MHDDRASIRRHHARASPKKSVAGRARGDPNPPHASVAGLIFWGVSSRRRGSKVWLNQQLFLGINSIISSIHQIYIWHHQWKADVATSRCYSSIRLLQPSKQDGFKPDWLRQLGFFSPVPRNRRQPRSAVYSRIAIGGEHVPKHSCCLQRQSRKSGGVA